MQVVKAIYQAGNIQLLSPLVGVEEAELLIVVLDKEGKTGIPAVAFRGLPGDSEQDFKALGITHFFDTDEDREVDWEEVFDVKPR
jgi:hypothetical protein